MIWKQPRRASPNEQNNDYKFMAVRHPLERLVSAWKYFTPGDRLRHSQVFRHSVWPDMPFDAFIELIVQHPMKDKHTTPQTRFKGDADIDLLVKLENLPKHWNTLVGRFSVDEITHKNKTDHDDWWTYYRPSLAQMALEAYGADLELYERAA